MIGQIVAGSYFRDLIVFFRLYEYVIVLKFLVFCEVPEVNLVPANGREL